MSAEKESENNISVLLTGESTLSFFPPISFVCVVMSKGGRESVYTYSIGPCGEQEEEEEEEEEEGKRPRHRRQEEDDEPQ